MECMAHVADGRGAMGESRRMIAAFISAPKPKMTAAI
jgi:hypothetical protein